MSDFEPPHRKQRYPLPQIEPVLATARQRRLSFLEAMAKVNSAGSLTEADRIAAQDELDNLGEEA